MFRKLVSNLAFSPALVGQLSFYAKRLRKEEMTRRFGLIFTALALVVQSFAVFQPPEAANASSTSDFIPGGFSNIQEYLRAYENNTRNIKDIFKSLGITKSEIANAKKGSINSKGVYSWGMTSRFSFAQGERTYKYTQSNGTQGVVYYRPLSLWDSKPYTIKYGSTYTAFIGHSEKFGWFALMVNCGNLITKKQPPAEEPPTSSCERLTATLLNRTRVRFNARADVANGAKINSYTYVVKNEAERVIHRKTILSHSETSSYTYDRDKPGKYTTSVKVDTSLGPRTDPACKAGFKIAAPPGTAVCSGLSANIVNRNTVEMTGNASVANGANVKKYTFVIKDKDGQIINRQEIVSDKLETAADAVVIEKPGEYKAELVVSTSEGEKTDPEDCVKAFTVQEPEMCPVNPSLPVDSEDCQPCPGNPQIWIKDADCDADVIQTKVAHNINQDRNATEVKAHPSDRISYTITVENRGFMPATASFEEQLGDVLEYAKVIDTGGGTLNEAKKVLSWPAIELGPAEKQSRTFVVKMLAQIPARNTGTSDQTSYDCAMINTFGNSTRIAVACPEQKIVVEQVVNELPTTGPRENMIFAGVLLTVVTYFYARARQTSKELRLIRRDATAGTI